MSTYLVREKGTVRKKWKGRLPVALFYPNSYPVAVSNLGFQLVYSLLNMQDRIVCERFVYPIAGEFLRSLESNRPLTDFPFVFGSVSFEEDYPRLVAMLAAGRTEPAAKSRSSRIGPGSPLVVLGGVAVFMNPEPLASFADIMVIGEAEAVLPDLLDQLAVLYEKKALRNEVLRRIACSLPGCYAPALYDFDFGENGEVVAIRSETGIPARVRKVVAGRMERAAHSRLLSPEAELGMFMTELGRGCSRGCRFCAAGFIYRPPRLWSVDQVLSGLAQRPPDIDRVGLLGMEMAASGTLDAISAFLQDRSCRLSFSSLRADRISGALLSLLSRSGLKSAAIAPDGASERLRRVINKGLTEKDLLTAAVRLVEAGILHLKLYVMIGLPTETDEDLHELAVLVRRLREALLPLGRGRGRMSELTLSVNSFVPKPWTPFQYVPFGGLDPEAAAGQRDEAAAGQRDEAAAVGALKRKIRYLRRELSGVANLRIKVDRPERIVPQAVFARGDRRLGRVLTDLAVHGLPFGRAMKKNGLSPWSYAVRPRGREEIFPWDVLDHGIRKEYLWQEYRRGLKAAGTKPCDTAKCRRCGVCNESRSA
ncbi:MAG TPA: radical SAM protein [Desulfobacteraceae bacterium]|nr:radical SAM protein [Desulfobacteraceae bacterium]